MRKMPKFFPGENCKIQSIFIFIYVLTELRAGQLKTQKKYNEITNVQSQDMSKPGDKGG
jgi:hypothetical protein